LDGLDFVESEVRAMRRLLASSVFLLPLASLLLAACGMPARDVEATQIAQPTATVASLPTQSGKESVEIEVHLWQDYNRDEVQIEIDGQVVFSDVVTTNDILSLAARIPLSVAEGSHRISVMINDATVAETTFRTQDLAVIAVSFDPSEENIRFEFLDFYPTYC
jgi:hypothetical protein